MDLHGFISSAARGTSAAIARAVGVDPVMVSQWASRVKPVPIARCPAIEAATGRAVMRWDLRPDDWHQIWPELVGAEGAPPVPGTQAANAAEVRDAA